LIGFNTWNILDTDSTKGQEYSETHVYYKGVWEIVKFTEEEQFVLKKKLYKPQEIMKKCCRNVNTTKTWMTLLLKYLLQIGHHTWENKGNYCLIKLVMKNVVQT
jgi:hypothetical protein